MFRITSTQPTISRNQLPGGTGSISAALKLKPRKCLVKPLKDVVRETHVEHGNQRSLQQTHQHVAPVVLVIRDAGVAHVHREGHQEELDGGPQKPGPLSNQSGLHVKLERGDGVGKGERGREGGKEMMTGWMERWKRERTGERSELDLGQTLKLIIIDKKIEEDFAQRCTVLSYTLCNADRTREGGGQPSVHLLKHTVRSTYLQVIWHPD